MKVYKYIGLFFYVLLMGFTVSASAEIEQGDRNATIFGSFNSSEGSDMLMLSGSYGVFVTDILEVQGAATLLSTDAFDVTMIGANANYYFPDSGFSSSNPDIVPYAGGGGSLIIISDFDNQISINGQVGMKQFLREDVAINYQLQHLVSTDYNATTLSVGITITLE